MQYIEELNNGDYFEFGGELFLLTCEQKKPNHRLAYDLKNGTPRWMPPDTMVNSVVLLSIDNNNNLFKLKEDKDNINANT
jgi:hypothetical protein